VTERRLKGINFVGTLKALERARGVEVRRAVEAHVAGDAGEALRTGAVVANGWYPASWYAALLASIVHVTNEGEGFVASLARDAVRADFQTLFKIVRLFISPQFALEQSLRVSRRYIDGGEIEIVGASTGHVHYRMSEYHGYTRLMWRDFVGGIEGVLETMGCRELTAHIRAGGADGEHQLEVELRWVP
jgi:hypothetical protein